MDNLRLLIYTHTFAPNIGGVETYTRFLAEGLAQRGVDVTVATRTPKRDFEDDRQPYAILRLSSHRELKAALQTQDVVHVAGAAIVPMWLSHRRGIPFVVEHHNYQVICPNGLLLRYPQVVACDGRYQKRDLSACWRCLNVESSPSLSLVRLLAMPLRRWLSAKAAANVGVTRHVSNRVSMPNSRTIYHGLPKPAPCLKSVANTGVGITFGYIGRLVAEKGLASLLEAAGKLAAEGLAFKLKIIGDGPLRPALSARAVQLGLEDKIVWTGVVQPEKIEEESRDIDVLILPSIWEETAGLVAIEQMLRGRAVIAAAIGGLAEIVGVAALTFPQGDVVALAQVMRRCCDDPAHTAAISAAGRVRAESEFKVERMVDEHLALYRTLLANATS